MFRRASESTRRLLWIAAAIAAIIIVTVVHFGFDRSAALSHEARAYTTVGRTCKAFVDVMGDVIGGNLPKAQADLLAWEVDLAIAQEPPVRR